MKTNKLLAVVVVLQGLILIGQWTGGGIALPAAQAQVSDPASRQIQMVEELRNVNSRLDQLVSILQSGDLQVRVKQTEEEKKKAAEPRAK
jgi:hypothetical protein